MALMTTGYVDGSRSPAVVARMSAYASNQGARGVVEPTHLKVIPLGGLSVGVTPGAALVAGGTTGITKFQTYTVGVDSTDGDATATVAGPTSSSRTLQVVVVVPDPEFAGVPTPTDPESAKYAELRVVSSAQESALTIPHYRLATLVIPANVAVITAAMIQDTRRVARPKSQRDLWAYDLSTFDGSDGLGAAGGESWPDIMPNNLTVDVPEWATEAKVICTFAQVLVPAGSTREGYISARLGGLMTPSAFYNAGNASSSSRQTFVALGTMSIPTSLRGQNDVAVYTRGSVTGGAGGYLVLDNRSAVSIDVEFVGKAV